MFDFGQKHLYDIFVLDGIQSISARDAILREIISNSLAHRDYSNGYIAKMIIEKDRILMENGNKAHGIGALNIETFKPFSKNPPLSKIFREIGYADELGSGMRNSYKYTRLYSGAEPKFIEGDVFEIIIPLTTGSLIKVGSGAQVSAQVDIAKLNAESLNSLLQFSCVPRTREELQQFCKIKSREYFRKNILSPLVENGLLLRTIPDKPNSKNQKYIASQNCSFKS